MKSSERGFTLIELMIVVAIVGILSSVAIPSYQNYIAKARYSEMVMAVSGIKAALSVGAHDGTAAVGNTWLYASSEGADRLARLDENNPNPALDEYIVSFKIPLPTADGKVVQGAYSAGSLVPSRWNVQGHGTPTLIITGTPREVGTIKDEDTLILRATLSASGGVAFGIDPKSGCKTKSGGAIC